jgi:hypothetical protein
MHSFDSIGIRVFDIVDIVNDCHYSFISGVVHERSKAVSTLVDSRPVDEVDIITRMLLWKCGRFQSTSIDGRRLCVDTALD